MALDGSVITKMLKSAGLGTTGLVATPQKIADLFNEAIAKYAPNDFNTADRIAALLSECMVESAWFRTTTEYLGPGGRPLSWQKKYYPYVGRTAIQITWADNYRKFGAWCKARGLVTDANYFVNNRARLGDLKWFALGAVWYFTQTSGTSWSPKKLVAYAGNIDQVGKAVNLGNPFSGGTPNGAAERRAAYRAIRPLGNALLPKTASVAKPSAIKWAPVRGSAAVKKALGWVGKPFPVGSCQRFTNELFGTGAVGDFDHDRDADAVDGWKAAVARGRVVKANKIKRLTDIPAAVMLYWSGGSHGYGHAAVSLGNGQMVSTDLPTTGRVGKVPISMAHDRWGLTFLGYAVVEGNGHTLISTGTTSSPKPAASIKEGVPVMAKPKKWHRTKPTKLKKSKAFQTIPINNPGTGFSLAAGPGTVYAIADIVTDVDCWARIVTINKKGKKVAYSSRYDRVKIKAGGDQIVWWDTIGGPAKGFKGKYVRLQILAYSRPVIVKKVRVRAAKEK